MNDLADVRSILSTCLSKLPLFNSCGLIGYPSADNVGDHLIWLVQIYWLAHGRGAKIRYAYGEREFRYRRQGNDPSVDMCLISGGGCLGDIYDRSLQLMHATIKRNHSNPVIILPQTIYFKDRAREANFFSDCSYNDQLILMVRDHVSYQTALRYLPASRVILSPDISFLLLAPIQDMGISTADSQRKKTLYLLRQDGESGGDVKLPDIKNTCMTTDWASGYSGNSFFKSSMHAAKYYLQHLTFARQDPLNLIEAPSFGQLPFWIRAKWVASCAHLLRGVGVLKDYSYVHTDRLHAHLLALMMGIPSCLHSNSYHKNESFYQAWLHDIPGSDLGAQARYA